MTRAGLERRPVSHVVEKVVADRVDDDDRKGVGPCARGPSGIGNQMKINLDIENAEEALKLLLHFLCLVLSRNFTFQTCSALLLRSPRSKPGTWRLQKRTSLIKWTAKLGSNGACICGTEHRSPPAILGSGDTRPSMVVGRVPPATGQGDGTGRA